MCNNHVATAKSTAISVWCFVCLVQRFTNDTRIFPHVSKEEREPKYVAENVLFKC